MQASMTWTGDDMALAVWAALGGRDIEIDEDPEAVIDRLRDHGYTWEQACAELGIEPTMRRELAVASAWAGIARVALRRRDGAICGCAAARAPLRALGAATGLTHSGVARVVERGTSPRGRW
jgi:hypothetical protein